MICATFLGNGVALKARGQRKPSFAGDTITAWLSRKQVLSEKDEAGTSDSGSQDGKAREARDALRPLMRVVLVALAAASAGFARVAFGYDATMNPAPEPTA